MIYVVTIHPSFEHERVYDASTSLDSLVHRLVSEGPYGVLSLLGIEELELKYDQMGYWWQNGENGTLKVLEFPE